MTLAGFAISALSGSLERSLGRAMRDRGIAAGRQALRLYAAAMRSPASLHYPHGPSSACGSSSPACGMTGFSRALERVLRPRLQGSSGNYVFTSHVLAGSESCPAAGFGRRRSRSPSIASVRHWAAGARPGDLKMLVSIGPPLSVPQQWGRQGTYTA